MEKEEQCWYRQQLQLLGREECEKWCGASVREQQEQRETSSTRGGCVVGRGIGDLKDRPSRAGQGSHAKDPSPCGRDRERARDGFEVVVAKGTRACRKTEGCLDALRGFGMARGVVVSRSRTEVPVLGVRL